MISPRLTHDTAQSSPRERRTFSRWLKFNGVGGIGIVVQLAALAVFRSWLGLDYRMATGLAVEAAVIQNFVWHERFTWADRPSGRLSQSLIRLLKFNASNGAVSIVGNILLMQLLVGSFRMNYVAGESCRDRACSLVNFFLSDRLVFQDEAAPKRSLNGAPVR